MILGGTFQRSFIFFPRPKFGHTSKNRTQVYKSLKMIKSCDRFFFFPKLQMACFTKYLFLLPRKLYTYNKLSIQVGNLIKRTHSQLKFDIKIFILVSPQLFFLEKIMFIKKSEKKLLFVCYISCEEMSASFKL